jgi:hypothetical protein
LAWRFVRVGVAQPPSAVPTDESIHESINTAEGGCATWPSFILHPSSFILPAGLVALAVALFTVAICWNPVGPRRDGRVMFVERHSTWEPTTRPYDTTWFGEPSGYNYAAIYDYLGQYYQMSRLLEKDKIDDETLAKCDVLIIKTPTSRYSPAEVDAVARFVKQGGGLLLIGDHTNYDRSTTTMNDITRQMGFIFRDDLLFGYTESPYRQFYVPATLPHPIVQHMPPMDFAVSCSIDPGFSSGRAAVVNSGLWSMGPEYHHDNYHPVPQHCPEMRYGSFIQVWAAWFGQGRAVAFSDSTIFSNFCVFQPGKAEMMLGLVEWLNHGNPLIDPRPWLLLLGLLPLAAGLWMGFGQGNTAGVWLLLLAAGSCGWVAASLAIAAEQRWATPEPECLRPEFCAVIDRTISNVPLSKGPDTQGENQQGYGLLEQWVARLGCYTVRKEWPEVFTGDALVVICPSRSVTEEYRRWLTEYVARGGKLLVIDSPENSRSQANSLLWPFGLSIAYDRTWKGKLTTTAGLPLVDVSGGYQVTGGTPVAMLDELAVGATVKYGKGSVMALGFGSLWNDKRMGEHWMLEPDAKVKARYDVLFGLLRPFLETKPLPAPPPPRAKKSAGKLPLKESGPAG